MGFISDIINTVKSVVSSVGSALGLSSGTSSSSSSNTQLGSVIVKPSEVSSVSKGTSYSVPETGVSGVSGGSSSQTSKAASSSRDLVPSGNINDVLASQGVNVNQSTTTNPQLIQTNQGSIFNQQQSIIPATKAERASLMSQAQKNGSVVIGGKSYNQQELMRLFGSEPLPDSELAMTPAENLQLAAMATGAAALPAIISTAAVGFTALTNYFTSIGVQASTKAGAQAIASTIPEAAGTIAKTAVGTVATNTATKTISVGFLSTLLKTKLGIGLLLSGGGATLIGAGASGAVESRKSATSYIKDAGAMITQLEESGMTNEANQLYLSMADLKDDFETVTPYIPWIGKVIETNKIQSYVDQLTDITQSYEKQNIEQAKQVALDERAYEEQQLQEQRRYDEQQLAEKRAYEEQLKEEERAYEEEKAAKEAEAAREAAYASEATATEGTGGSTLTFGILNSGGDTEYVDIQKASQFYFGKAYEELTEAQKRLLMLSKGSQ